MYETKRIFITVKTYPVPSEKYMETVCTAGFTEDGSFLRLYPIEFRYLKENQKYGKYQWIEVDIEKHEEDKRKESYRPKTESINLMEKVDTQNKWSCRKDIVFKHPVRSMEELWEEQENDNTSLGIVKPKEVTDVEIVMDDEQWKPKWEAMFQQPNLFGLERKNLTKIPYKFIYHFTCDDDRCNGHKMMITDWEAGVLYLREFARYGNKEKAAESVRSKFLNELCGADKDPHFFVGTVHKWNTWIVIGVFWPPEDHRQSLF